MGYYVNPKEMSKESFLDKYGTLISNDYDYMANFDHLIAEHTAPKCLPCLPVVLLNNGPFTAAGICYDQGELGAFSEPQDMRPKKLYMVPIDKLLETLPEAQQTRLKELLSKE